MATRLKALIYFCFNVLVHITCTTSVVEMITILHGGNASLKCPISDTTRGRAITWTYSNENIVYCDARQRCDPLQHASARYTFMRNDTITTLSISSVQLFDAGNYTCKTNGKNVLQSFNLTVVDLPHPICHFSPYTTEISTTNHTIQLRCELDAVLGVDFTLKLHGVQSKFASRYLTTNVISVDLFKDTHENITCQLSFENLNESRYCSFPQYVYVKPSNNVSQVNDAQFMITESRDHILNITWSLWMNGLRNMRKEIHSERRAWIGYGGTRMLLTNITKDDWNTVVTCEVWKRDGEYLMGFASLRLMQANGISEGKDNTLVGTCSYRGEIIVIIVLGCTSVLSLICNVILTFLYVGLRKMKNTTVHPQSTSSGDTESMHSCFKDGTGEAVSQFTPDVPPAKELDEEPPPYCPDPTNV